MPAPLRVRHPKAKDDVGRPTATTTPPSDHGAGSPARSRDVTRRLIGRPRGSTSLAFSSTRVHALAEYQLERPSIWFGDNIAAQRNAASGTPPAIRRPRH